MGRGRGGGGRGGAGAGPLVLLAVAGAAVAEAARAPGFAGAGRLASEVGGGEAGGEGGGRSKVSWGSSPSGAAELVAKMTLEEKSRLLGGGRPVDPTKDFPYVGQTAGIPRLGVPEIHMSDGPQGFRDMWYPGTSTAFPSALALASTWDPELAREMGAAMAEEFVDKGADVLLGPGLNVLRVPECGRSFEYLSGEDPRLGAAMVGPLVDGIQGKGVVATAKHYVGNTQETDRGSINEIVDDRTLHELYLPPFEAAVKAGVGSVMCAYNRFNGPWSCGSDDAQNRILKGEMGFKGFVVSDWGATHATDNLAHGLDMEMPTNPNTKYEVLKNATDSGALQMAVVDAAAERILSTMMQFRKKRSGSKGDPAANVTTEAHARVARRVAAASAILLRNEAGILPIPETGLAKIAVLGDKGHDAPLTTGTGSGAVWSPRNSTILDGIRERSAATADPSGPTEVVYRNSKDISAAAEAAAEADLAVVVVGVESGEGKDRPDLALPAEDDALIAAVAKVNPATVVVVQAPGPVLMPWADDVQAILLTVFAGQEAGSAAATALYDEVSGRLPFSVPAKPGQDGFTPEQYPGVGGNAVYSEELFIGYRRYQREPANLARAPPQGLAWAAPPRYFFGFGLSYSEFHYSDVRAEGTMVSATVTNIGTRTGSEVAQLYITYPEAAAEPPAQLKAFKRVRLSPGESARVQWTLSARDLAVWDTAARRWAAVPGQYRAYVAPCSGCLGGAPAAFAP